MSKRKYYKRITECPDGWWTKNKLYEVTYRCGKAHLTDDEGAFMFLEECNLAYLRSEFEPVSGIINHRLSAKDNKIENLTWRK